MPARDEDDGDQAKSRWERFRKAIVTVVLTVQVAAMVLALRYSKTSTTYLSSTAVVASEMVKIFACLGVLVVQHGCGVFGYLWAELLRQPSDLFQVAIPALLYLVQNNLLFFAMERLDAALYQVTYQAKTLTTAICSVTMLQRTITRQQWLALLVLTAGVALAQFQPSSSHAGHAVQGEQAAGISALLLACFTSGFAGVYTEKLLKQSRVSMWIRNLQLALWSVLAGMFVVWSQDRVAVRENGFFGGYTSIVWLVVVLQGATGICVALVMKFADNIVKNFSVAMSLLLSTMASIPLFGFWPSQYFCFGALLVLQSVVLYSTPDAGRYLPVGLRALLKAPDKEEDDLKTMPV